MYTHTKPVMKNGKVEQASWRVDMDALRYISDNRWITSFPQLLEKDLREMSESFPRWYLVAGSARKSLACHNDGEYIVPKDGALRCLLCGEKYQGRANATSLIWTGFLPVPLTGANVVIRNFRSRQKQGLPILPYLERGPSLFMFTPVNVFYPGDWPNTPALCYYASELFWRSMGKGLPSFGHSMHMYQDMQMCLFSDWPKMSIRDVIQNRVLPHSLAHVKIANGERPETWFN